MSNIGERIRSLRKTRGYTQVELSNRSGLTQGQISKYERYAEAPAEALLKIAEALDTSIDYLIGRTEDSSPPLKLSPEERAILEPLLRRLRERGNLTVDEITEFWLDNLPKDPGLDDFGKA
ncbi:MAG: helix-turn-helix transcriptional regulator [Anaerolineae bacterium]|nr:helix-turn-helix transcriptional regulator [Anaerolineae bacterium]